MMWNKINGLIFWCILSYLSGYAANDTLYLEKYVEVVLSHHPLIQKANLNDDITAAYLLKGRGTLDPKLYSDYEQKQFDNTDYFTIWESSVKIPTSLPIDFSVGYERNDGTFLNSERNVPSNGLVYGTINLSLLRGLLFDEQRYDLQSAQLNGLKSQIERDIVTREILFQAINTYLEWTAKTTAFNIHQEYLELVNERHQNVIQLFVNGDSPAIDTIESRLNLNSANKLLLESSNEVIQAKQKLSLFIWNDEGQPLALNDEIHSMTLQEVIVELKTWSLLLQPDFNTDPLIAKIDNAIQSIQLDSRLEREYLKPQLDLKYNTILNLGKQNFDPSFTANDYKFGVAFQYPILNRKSKGQLKMNDALTVQNELEKVEYLGRLNNKFVGLLSQEVIQEEVLQVTTEKLTNSQLLYDAERFKFSLGESSVFLLNQRERKLLEAQMDLAKSVQSLGKILIELYYLKLGQM